MKRQNSVKRSLVASLLVLCLCFTALAGTTFAWFTDSAVTGSNVITAGNLDIDVEYTLDGQSWSDLKGASDLFKKGLWEPGHTEVVALKITNAGDLALKYVANLKVLSETKGKNANGDDIVLSDLLVVSTLVAAEADVATAFDNEDALAYTGTALLKDTSALRDEVEMMKNDVHYLIVKVDMPDSIGNEANYYGETAPKIDLGIEVLATQYNHENDSFGNQYDKDAIYPINIIASKPVINNENKTAENVNITYADASSVISKVEVLVPQGTQLEAGVTELLLSIKEADGVNDDVATMITSNQTATTYEISLDGVDATNDKDITVTLVIEKGLVDVKLYHKDELIPCTYDADTGELTFATKGFSPFTVVSATKVFEEGEGTADDPYIIKTAEDLLNISKYFHEYKYYKVAGGVETLDMTGIGRLKLNGSFDGNGVTMNNLTTALFECVGKVGVAQDIKISNLTANVNTTDGRALVRNIYNPGTTTFENVALHGYIEGQYNMGSFYNYGTANAGGSDGADYTVSFVNATSDATLVCTTGNVIGGMLGHGYEGADYKLSINMDANSKYTGKMYTTNGKDCYQVMAMCSHGTYVLNGEEISRYTNTYPSTKLVAANPTVGDDGYYVASVEGVDHYVVSLEAQLTAYDENGVKIPNMAGLTWSLGKETITEGFEGKIFDLVTSAEIVNDENLKIGYDLSDGVLKVYTGRDTNYASGWITLNVTQYDADGTILATGNVRVYTFVEP